MKLLVTAGNTQTPLDRVRCITNIFSGRTGTNLALEAERRGHDVCLVTSHPELASDSRQSTPANSLAVRVYRTFDDLRDLMADVIPQGDFDAIIHCAAVSDFHVEGVFSPANGTQFDQETNSWRPGREGVQLHDAGAGKVKSQHRELWLRLAPTPKLIDMIRASWRFRGVLVKFKLEVGVTDSELQVIAERSRRQSQADIVVANTLEGMSDYALLGQPAGYERIARTELSERVLTEIEQLVASRRAPQDCFPWALREFAIPEQYLLA